MTDLAGIVARDAQFQPKGNSGSSWTVDARDTKLRLLEDRRALLALLRETRDALAIMAAPDDIGGGWAEIAVRRRTIARATLSALAALDEPTP